MSPEKPLFNTKPDADVKVPRGQPRSKTWAIRHLSKFFVAPHIKIETTKADRAAGVSRWRVFCTNRQTGRSIGLVEVAGPIDALAKAALIGACRRISISVKLDATGGVSFEQAPPATTASEPATTPPTSEQAP